MFADTNNLGSTKICKNRKRLVEHILINKLGTKIQGSRKVATCLWNDLQKNNPKLRVALPENLPPTINTKTTKQSLIETFCGFLNKQLNEVKLPNGY